MKTILALTALVWIGLRIPGTALANQTDIPGPPGSGFFGVYVTVLPNGNFVVADPFYDAPGPVDNVGAVRLYTSAGVLISTFTGSSAGDEVGGGGGIVVLSNGHYVVISSNWNNDAGAVTWCDRDTGLSGTVSAVNSLVGSTTGDGFIIRVTALTNGNYVVACPHWDRGATADAGVARLCSGASGTAGTFSILNSLVGVNAGDEIGREGSVALTNGNYVVISSRCDNGTAVSAGAITWGDGSLGVVGEATVSNSLMGSTSGDSIGGTFDEINMKGVVALTNGHYVVRSKEWDRGGIVNAGAVTWCNGNSGRIGTISDTNSLVGTVLSDRVGDDGIVALSNGNYVVCSSVWNNGGVADAGAVTWGSGTGGVSGEISSANSLVGSAASDLVGNGGATALTNGNYVAISTVWDGGGTASIGAVTWGDGTTGRVGEVTAVNSLTGTNSSDQAGWGGVTALSNGHYVVSSPQCDSGAINTAGAATWGDGASGTAGVISTANSLMGTTAVDQVSFGGIIALTNGNYVVCSPRWNRGAITDAGAATWRDGTGPSGGTVALANSLVGSAASDQIGSLGGIALTNGHYVVSSPLWNRAGATDAGAATWGDGTSGITGTISPFNSLVGDTTGDQVGGVLRALGGGDYYVWSSAWDSATDINVGAVTLCIGSAGTTGDISAVNSIRGTVGAAGGNLWPAYEPLSETLIVGQPPANLLSLFKYRPDIAVFDGPGLIGERQDNASAFEFGLITTDTGPVEQTFILKNVGKPDITGLSLSLAPTGNPGDFTLGAPGTTTLAPVATTEFTVTFDSAVSGTRTATILIASNDPDETPFEIPLTVLSLTPIEAWRDIWFGSIENTGDSADMADPDFDGLINILEYALETVPTEPSNTSVPAIEIIADQLTFTFTRNSSANWLNWFIESSETLQPASWSVVASKTGTGAWTSIPGATVNEDFGFVTTTDSEPASANNQRFMRLRIETP